MSRKFPISDVLEQRNIKEIDGEIKSLGFTPAFLMNKTYYQQESRN